MKRVLSIFLLQFFILGLIFGATINSKQGYGNLKWGSSVDDAKKAGYKLSAMTSASDKQYLSKLYTVDVNAYKVTSNDKNVTALQFHYYNGKLFSVTETLKIAELTPQKLEGRYGNFATQGISMYREQYMDVKFEKGGSVASLSIIISKSSGKVSAVMYDWDTYKNISYVGQQLKKTANTTSIGSEKSIIDELSGIANNLVQEKVGSAKPSFAFLAFTTDYQNTLVENYVTDALTEAMFNTGKIKIIERANLEAILEEQKFQSSGLVNEETVKSIGMIAGVDFVCYGTLKDLGATLTINARVVDVETGELCAISRATITKDDYLKQQPQSAVGAVKTNDATKTSDTTTTTTTATQVKTTTSVANNAWKVTKYTDEFGGFTHYVFTINSTDSKKLFISYEKCSNAANSKVRTGVHWGYTAEASWQGPINQGTYDIKGQTGNTVTKNLSTLGKCQLDISTKNYFLYAWDEKAGARWLVDIIRNSDSVAVRRDGLTRRFQTAGLLEKMAEYGITWEEIDAALANEEF